MRAPASRFSYNWLNAWLHSAIEFARRPVTPCSTTRMFSPTGDATTGFQHPMYLDNFERALASRKGAVRERHDPDIPARDLVHLTFGRPRDSSDAGGAGCLVTGTHEDHPGMVCAAELQKRAPQRRQIRRGRRRSDPPNHEFAVARCRLLIGVSGEVYARWRPQHILIDAAGVFQKIVTAGDDRCRPSHDGCDLVLQCEPHNRVSVSVVSVKPGVIVINDPSDFVRHDAFFDWPGRVREELHLNQRHVVLPQIPHDPPPSTIGTQGGRGQR